MWFWQLAQVDSYLNVADNFSLHFEHFLKSGCLCFEVSQVTFVFYKMRIKKKKIRKGELKVIATLNKNKGI